MTEVSWIKIRIDMFDDEKIRLIQAMPESDAILIMWVRLIALAGKTNDNGLVYINPDLPYTDEILATLFNKPLNTVRLALKTLQNFKMIDVFDNGKILIVNFDKHQSADGLDKIREKNRLRQQKYYERQKLLKASNSNKDIDKDKEEDKEKSVSITLYNVTKNFDKLWSIYPKKQGKTAAFKAYQKAIKSGVTDELISQKINEYLKYLEANKDWLKPANGSTWFSQERWNDDYSLPAGKKTVTTLDDIFGS